MDATRRGEVWTNRLIVSSPAGGIALLPEKKNSNMPFCHTAPERFDNNQIDFSYIRSRRVLFEDREMKDGEFLVFQTSRNGESEEEPHFGIIRKLEFWPGGLRMEYFFNPTPGDRRTDADIRSKRDYER